MSEEDVTSKTMAEASSSSSSSLSLWSDGSQGRSGGGGGGTMTAAQQKVDEDLYDATDHDKTDDVRSLLSQCEARRAPRSLGECVRVRDLVTHSCALL